jgi:hypothetical protein
MPREVNNRVARSPSSPPGACAAVDVHYLRAGGARAAAVLAAAAAAAARGPGKPERAGPGGPLSQRKLRGQSHTRPGRTFGQ